MNKKILIFILGLLIISGCQEKEIVRLGISIGSSPYDTAMEYYKEGDYEEAIEIYKEILTDIEKGVAEGGIDEYWVKGMIARSYLEINEYDFAKPYIEEAITGYMDYQETGEGYAFICQTEGIYFKQTGQYEKAIESLEKSIEYTDEKNDHSVRGYIEMGFVYEYLNEENKQLDCYKKALNHAEKIKDYVDLYQIYTFLGIYYAERGDVEKGEEMFYKSLDSAEKAWGKESAGVADVYHSLAANFNLKGQYEEAIQCSERALTIYLNLEKKVYSKKIASLYNNLGIFYLKLEQEETAMTMMRKSYEIVKENQEKKNISEFYENVLSVNIKALYDKTAADEIEYDEWFKQNFESYEGVVE